MTPVRYSEDTERRSATSWTMESTVFGGNQPPVKGPDGPRTTPFSGIRYPNDTTPAGGNPREGHKREKEKGNKQKGPSGNPHGIRPEGKKRQEEYKKWGSRSDARREARKESIKKGPPGSQGLDREARYV